ncbi:DEAD/DEAH box helicase [Nonomuraea sp. NBC_01738]|uniref:DEAD/DEAH box helicase n=1 Tax=Nonomuraea sp. NBC_01738 TaxID=2976003 RepID=UPI002E126FCC|nr:DEAD/DEAH box helicase [Nonomuraea sp. NBC_01738]
MRLRPYPHQVSAVYGAMLPQPQLRFLLADEPGTGKTVMAGLFLREMRSRGLIRRALVVAPAGLVSKWQADFERFFGGGLHRITPATVREKALVTTGHEIFVVSLELASVNGAVFDAIDPDQAGWDLVIFDEAHRLTPTATAFHRVGQTLASKTPQVLLMTATPHRGSEWLFRHLLHLVDPEIYPDPGNDPKERLPALRPGNVHFLRRMKEDLVDHDGTTRLFHGRRATNYRVPLNPAELELYEQALNLVDTFFPKHARTLARMVYGKRAASCLFALAQTLRRRFDHLLAETESQLDTPDDDLWAEAEVVAGDSLSAEAERAAVHDLLDQVDHLLSSPLYLASKWNVLLERCLAVNGIRPNNREQAVIFTEYADSAEWIVRALAADGYSARVYSGRQSHGERDAIRAAYMRGEFQIIVSTDAGNEGIDLQVAHVLINYDIPWSLVRLEQRMGRIHRVGQQRDVELYNLVAAETREGDTLLTLLENFASAANELDGQMFDSLSLVAELANVRYEEWLQALYGDNELKKAEALEAAKRVNVGDLRRSGHAVRVQEAELATTVDTMAGLARTHPEQIESLTAAEIEGYLRVLDTAKLVTVHATAASESIFLLTSKNRLPRGLGGRREMLVALDSSTPAELDSGARVTDLTPGSPALRELITDIAERLSADTFRGGVAQDAGADRGYVLYAFEASLNDTPWSVLIKVTVDGLATEVPWRILTGLTPTREYADGPWPDDHAVQEAERLLLLHVHSRESMLSEWLAVARRELGNLPIDMTLGVRDRAERISLRDRLTTQTQRRLALLDDLCRVDADRPRLTARLRVLPGSSRSVR